MAVLDASAILAYVYGEPGADRVADVLAEASISAVNAAEVVSKLVERNTPQDAFQSVWEMVSGMTQPFTAAQALRSGQLRDVTRAFGLSLGDRACLALAEDMAAPALTADRVWAGLDLDVNVEVIR